MDFFANTTMLKSIADKWSECEVVMASALWTVPKSGHLEVGTKLVKTQGVADTFGQ